jgi:hypothetical protein
LAYSEQASARSFELLTGDGLGHLYGMDRALEKIWSKRPPIAEGYVLVSDGEMATSIIDFVTHFGHVSTLLFDDGSKRTSENNATYRIRMERVERVAQFFEGIDTNVFKDRRIRNRHFHADEYVAKSLLKYPDAVIIQDLAFNKRELMKSQLQIIYIRAYEFDSDTLLHLEAEFDVKKLYEISLLMVDKLKQGNQ